MKSKTWHTEAFVVAAILAGVADATGGKAVEWLGALAVLVTFLHAQVGFRLAEADERRTQGEAVGHAIMCYRWLTRYFYAKEILWLGYFVWLGAWSALVGVGIFLAYPLWRKFWIARRVRLQTNAQSQAQAGAPKIPSEPQLALPCGITAHAPPQDGDAIVICEHASHVDPSEVTPVHISDGMAQTFDLSEHGVGGGDVSLVRFAFLCRECLPPPALLSIDMHLLTHIVRSKLEVKFYGTRPEQEQGSSS